MARVSENSASNSLSFALNRAKEKMEKLQLKGATLKNLTRPSDNPLNNIEALQIKSELADNKQYMKNANYALMNLEVSENSIEQLTDIVGKAKEIAISQASDLFGVHIRKNVANEVHQLRNQSLAIGNRRVGNKYVFSGFSTTKAPFRQDGSYHGDKGHVKLEISKDFFIQTNLHGDEVFFETSDSLRKQKNPLQEIDELKRANETLKTTGRGLSSVKDADGFQARNNLFAQLDSLAIALENNDTKTIQGLIEKFDDTQSRLITMRTRIGSLVASIHSSKTGLENDAISKQERKSYLVDADVAELFSDITKHQELMKTTYQSSQSMLNQNLMDFIK